MLFRSDVLVMIIPDPRESTGDTDRHRKTGYHTEHENGGVRGRMIDENKNDAKHKPGKTGSGCTAVNATKML